jgi:hypothetical protein
MKAIDVDARRYAWCRGHALWIVSMPAQTYLEDLRGAIAAEQDGLMLYAARRIGETCAVALNLATNYSRPIPPRSMRTAWALDGIRDHELWRPCLELVQGPEGISPAELMADCDSLMSKVHVIVGEAPDILTPEGYFPAIAVARDWLNLLDAVGEEGFLPRDWTRST